MAVVSEPRPSGPAYGLGPQLLACGRELHDAGVCRPAGHGGVPGDDGVAGGIDQESLRIVKPVTRAAVAPRPTPLARGRPAHHGPIGAVRARREAARGHVAVPVDGDVRRPVEPAHRSRVPTLPGDRAAPRPLDDRDPSLVAGDLHATGGVERTRAAEGDLSCDAGHGRQRRACPVRAPDRQTEQTRQGARRSVGHRPHDIDHAARDERLPGRVRPRDSTTTW